MALGTSGGMQRLGMTGAAGTTAVIDAPAAFVCNARVRTFIDRRPVISGMTLRAIQTKHARVEGRIIMATRTCR